MVTIAATAVAPALKAISTLAVKADATVAAADGVVVADVAVGVKAHHQAKSTETVNALTPKARHQALT